MLTYRTIHWWSWCEGLWVCSHLLGWCRETQTLLASAQVPISSL